MIKPCLKCHEGILQPANVRGQQVIVCRKCKTIFGKDESQNPQCIQMNKCDDCGKFYYKEPITIKDKVDQNE